MFNFNSSYILRYVGRVEVEHAASFSKHGGKLSMPVESELKD